MCSKVTLAGTGLACPIMGISRTEGGHDNTAWTNDLSLIGGLEVCVLMARGIFSLWSAGLACNDLEIVFRDAKHFTTK